MSTYTWIATGATAADTSVASNWEGGTAPPNDGSADIEIPGNYLGNSSAPMVMNSLSLIDSLHVNDSTWGGTITAPSGLEITQQNGVGWDSSLEDCSIDTQAGNFQVDAAATLNIYGNTTISSSTAAKNEIFKGIVIVAGPGNDLGTGTCPGNVTVVGGTIDVTGTIGWGLASMTIGGNLSVYSGGKVVADGQSATYSGNATIDGYTTIDGSNSTLNLQSYSNFEASYGGNQQATGDTNFPDAGLLLTDNAALTMGTASSAATGAYLYANGTYIDSTSSITMAPSASATANVQITSGLYDAGSATIVNPSATAAAGISETGAVTLYNDKLYYQVQNNTFAVVWTATSFDGRSIWVLDFSFYGNCTWDISQSKHSLWFNLRRFHN
jgi:hypothetical protein